MLTSKWIIVSAYSISNFIPIFYILAKIIIPVAVGAVVLLMALAAAVVVIKYRRYKARYGQHTMLIGEEDDDRDNDEPMVEA